MVQTMVWRRSFEKLRVKMHTKSVFRGAAVAGDTLAGLGAHGAEVKPGYVAGFPGTRGAVAAVVEAVDGKELSDEDVLGRLALHINHNPVRWRCLSTTTRCAGASASWRWRRRADRGPRRQPLQ